MKDIQLLTNRFLAGETTREEERRLYDLLKGDGVTAEQKMLRDIIRPAADEPDTDAWLMEDMTDEYDRVVAGRRRRTLFVRLAAAAAVIAFVFLAGVKFGGREDSNIPVVAKVEANRNSKAGLPPVGPAIVKERPGLQEVAKSTAEKDVELPVVSQPDIAEPDLLASAADEKIINADMTLSDSLTDIIERIERGLENVSDSVYIARVEELIESDSRLQRLMRRVLVDKITRDNQNYEAYEQW